LEFGIPNGNTYTVDVVVPFDVECERCVLQMTYQTANSGDGYPETFWNCADVSVIPAATNDEGNTSTDGATSAGTGTRTNTAAGTDVGTSLSSDVGSDTGTGAGTGTNTDTPPGSSAANDFDAGNGGALDGGNNEGRSAGSRDQSVRDNRGSLPTGWAAAQGVAGATAALVAILVVAAIMYRRDRRRDVGVFDSRRAAAAERVPLL
jgi:hypothetical protein